MQQATSWSYDASTGRSPPSADPYVFWLQHSYFIYGHLRYSVSEH